MHRIQFTVPATDGRDGCDGWIIRRGRKGTEFGLLIETLSLAVAAMPLWECILVSNSIFPNCVEALIHVCESAVPPGAKDAMPRPPTFSSAVTWQAVIIVIHEAWIAVQSRRVWICSTFEEVVAG